MAFISVEDIAQPASSPIAGIFSRPQNEPVPLGYIGEIDDADPRIATFLQSQSQP